VSNDVEVLVEELIDAVCGLAAANRFTGLWDHVRFSECKRPDADIRRDVLILSERMSRHNVELRAFHRGRIERAFRSLIEIAFE
jgi:hypothetical protein